MAVLYSAKNGSPDFRRRLSLDLAHAFTGNRQLATKLIERERLIREPPRFEYGPFSLSQRTQSRAKSLGPGLGLVLRSNDLLCIWLVVDEHRFPFCCLLVMANTSIQR